MHHVPSYLEELFGVVQAGLRESRIALNSMEELVTVPERMPEGAHLSEVLEASYKYFSPFFGWEGVVLNPRRASWGRSLHGLFLDLIWIRYTGYMWERTSITSRQRVS